MARIIALLCQASEREALVQSAPSGLAVSFCASAATLSDAVNREYWDGIICDVRDCSGAPVSDGLLRAGVRAQSVPISMLLALTTANARELVRLTDAGMHITAHLRGFDFGASLVGALAVTCHTVSPQARILRSIREYVPPSARDVVVGTVVLGAKRCAVGDVAAACSLSARSVERRMSAARLPAVHTLLGWSLALHALWRLDVLDWSIKRAATAAGFPNRDTFAAYIKRQTGSAIGEIRRCGGFESLLEEFSLLWQTGGTRVTASVRE